MFYQPSFLLIRTSFVWSSISIMNITTDAGNGGLIPGHRINWTDIEGSNGLGKGPRTMKVIHSYPLPPNGWHQELMMMIIIIIIRQNPSFSVPRQLVYGHFVYDTSSTDISSTDISSTTVYQRVAQLHIQLLFQQIIIFINSNFYLHYDSFS